MFNISGYSYELAKLSDDELFVWVLYRLATKQYVSISAWNRIKL